MNLQKEELEHQLNIKKIFPTHIGNVAGHLMNRILEKYPDVPLINAMITRPDGIPGKGIEYYFSCRYPHKRIQNWDTIRYDRKKRLVEDEHKKIRNYDYNTWDRINKEVFGNIKIILREIPIGEVDPHNRRNLGGQGGIAESNEHKKLKDWAAKNPREIGLRGFELVEKEHCLLSADTVDVLFSKGSDYAVVEVKSCRSNDNDFQRGIYQCVKYRAVKQAENHPFDINVKAVLVTERSFPPELAQRARILNITVKCVTVNPK